MAAECPDHSAAHPAASKAVPATARGAERAQLRVGVLGAAGRSVTVPEMCTLHASLKLCIPCCAPTQQGGDSPKQAPNRPTVAHCVHTEALHALHACRQRSSSDKVLATHLHPLALCSAPGSASNFSMASAVQAALHSSVGCRPTSRPAAAAAPWQRRQQQRRRPRLVSSRACAGALLCAAAPTANVA